MSRFTSKPARAACLSGLLAVAVAALGHSSGALAETTSSDSNAPATSASTTSRSGSVFKPAPAGTSGKAAKNGNAKTKPDEK